MPLFHSKVKYQDVVQPHAGDGQNLLRMPEVYDTHKLYAAMHDHPARAANLTVRIESLKAAAKPAGARKGRLSKSGEAQAQRAEEGRAGR